MQTLSLHPNLIALVLCNLFTLMWMVLSLFTLTPASAIGYYSLMTTHGFVLSSQSKPSRTPLKHSKLSKHMPRITTVRRSALYEMTREGIHVQCIPGVHYGGGHSKATHSA